MAGETTITIIGNLTADPELRTTPGGAAVANFTVASTARMYDRQSGAWKDGDAVFLRCGAWGVLGEQVAASLTRGVRVIVTGQLRQRSYDKGGERRSVIELRVDDIGPSLRRAATAGKRDERAATPTSTTPADDPWGSRAPVPMGAVVLDDEPPF